MEEGIGRLMARHFARMESHEQADAYVALVLGFVRAGYSLALAARDSGRKSDMHFVDAEGRRPYGLIVNKRDLLFYLRKHAGKPDLSAIGLEVNIRDNVGEASIRVLSERDARTVMQTLGL